MTIKPPQPWPYWVLIGAVLVLIVYPLSLGPLMWLMVVLGHQFQSWVEFETLFGWWEVYSAPAFFLGGTATDRLAVWLGDYVEWWRLMAVRMYATRV